MAARPASFLRSSSGVRPFFANSRKERIMRGGPVFSGSRPDGRQSLGELCLNLAGQQPPESPLHLFFEQMPKNGPAIGVDFSSNKAMNE